MKTHISYPKIQQFRNIVTAINRMVTFAGVDKEGEAIYDASIKKPTLRFKGTVKLHGTNASVCFNQKDGFWMQSRQNIITIEQDNAGFAIFASRNKDVFMHMINQIIAKHNIDTKEVTVSIYGEWAGKGIQKSVGISQLEKAFYIFGVKISNPKVEEFKSYWLPSVDIRNIEKRIFNVEDYKTYNVDVDFNMPQLAQNKFIEITESVEKECPIAKTFGIENGLGEGVVWTVSYKNINYRFKVKGEKHSVSKVKKLASVNVEKLNSIKEFVDYAVTENRFNQSIENTFGKEDLDVKRMGELLRWMIKDIMLEETDTLKENDLVPKDVNKYISLKTKELFFNRIKQF